MQDQRKPTVEIDVVSALVDGLGTEPSERNPYATEQNFAYMMRRLRQQRGLSQTALADALRPYGLKLDGTAITRMEKNAVSGSTPPRAIRLAEADAIARVLGTTVQAMITPAAAHDQLLRGLEEQRDEYAKKAQLYQDAMRAVISELTVLRKEVLKLGGEHSETP